VDSEVSSFTVAIHPRVVHHCGRGGSQVRLDGGRRRALGGAFLLAVANPPPAARPGKRSIRQGSEQV
jgi:hypothetical protein